MSSPGELLALRKRVLLARGALQRVSLRAEIEGIRRGLSPGGMLVAASSPGRLLRLGLAGLSLGKMVLGFLRRRRGRS